MKNNQSLYAVMHLAALLVLLLGSAPLFAQTRIIIWDNYENYNLGDRVAESSEAWNTFDLSDGGRQDATVTDKLSYSGAKSMRMDEESKMLVDNRDVIDDGQVASRWYVYLPKGSSAKFGLLQEFSQRLLRWGSEIFLNNNGVGQINPLHRESATFTFDFDVWVQVDQFVDLKTDIAELWVDDEKIYSWNWSGGNTGKNQTRTFQSAAFEQGSTGGIYFVDDVAIRYYPPRRTTTTKTPPTTGRPFSGNGSGDVVALEGSREGEEADLIQIRVFPNPAHDAIVVTMSNALVLQMQLFDLSGQEIRSANFPKGSPRARLEVGDVPGGMYILRFGDDREQQHHRRVFIQH